MAAESVQTRLLNRTLTMQLVRDIVIFTAIFLLIAITANTFLRPRLADFVADSTSEWETVVYGDLPVSEALDIVDGTAYSVAQSWDEANERWNAEERFLQIEEVSNSSEADAPIESSSEDALFRAKTEASLIAQGFTPLSTEEIDQLASSGTLGPNSLLLCAIEGGLSEWIAVRDLQSTAASSKLLDFALNDQWQVIYGADQVSFRDLTTYNVIKAFKYPVLVILYLIGFSIIIFFGFGRSLRYFDELSEAVGSIIAHRDQPVRLSKLLLPTQEELEKIRLSSLADERAAQAAERRKDELVAYLAHDVKTPLTSVIGYLSLLEEAPDMAEESRKRYIATALAKSERLEGLIDEFFEITRYNLQAIPIERSSVEIDLFCRQVVEEFYPQAEARDLKMVITAPEGERFFVDPQKMARALGNVIRNAVAYADQGTTVSIHAESIQQDTPHWELSVTDQGCEISPVHLQSIFEKFYRESAARSTSDGQAGLGLAIAKEIIVAHGGAICAHSEGGKTTFTISIPA